jgi:hypothetical protein
VQKAALRAVRYWLAFEVMTTELEMVVDPTVGGEEALRVTR